MRNDTRRKEKEQIIYGAVLRLIAGGQQISDIKVQQIATEAGMGKGTVYEYFDSKEEILQGMVDDCLRRELLGFRSAVEHCTTLEEAVEVYLDYLEQGLLQRSGTYKIVGEALRNYHLPENHEEKRLLAQELLTPLKELYDRLRQNGELCEAATPAYCAYVLGSAMTGMSAALAPEKPLLQGERLRCFARQMIMGALSRKIP